MAQIDAPQSISLDSAGNLYFAEPGNNRVRKVDSAGTITTVAGNGKSGFSGDHGAATQAQLANPFNVAADSQGRLFIADEENNRIRMIDAAGVITTIAGTGAQGYSGDGVAAVNAVLGRPLGLTIDSAGRIYVAAGNYVRVLLPGGLRRRPEPMHVGVGK